MHADGNLSKDRNDLLLLLLLYHSIHIKKQQLKVVNILIITLVLAILLFVAFSFYDRHQKQTEITTVEHLTHQEARKTLLIEPVGNDGRRTLFCEDGRIGIANGSSEVQFTKK